MGILLALGILGAFLQTHAFGFIDYDDPTYVSANPHVLGGLSRGAIRWAFTNLESANWHPLTWISLQADVTLFGPAPGAMHLVNVAFHLANSVLLFVLLSRLFKGRWKGAFIAALFALHPCHVESVAWISERKDVLSGFFWILTTLAYLGWVRRPSGPRYGLLIGLFVLGMMAKPMVITLPLTLLLLDYWPLGRLGGRGDLGACLREKAPLFALAALLGGFTFMAQKLGGAVSTLQDRPLGLRLGNALLSTFRYLAKGLWPTRLAFFYPYPASPLPLGPLVGAAALGVAISAFALAQRHRRPWLLVGWAWYLVTLLPVIGIVQVGAQAMADRYTYLPFLGPFLILAFALEELRERRPGLRLLPPLAAAGILGACLALTPRQVRTWRDDYALADHARRVTKGNVLAELKAGYALESQGHLEEACQAYARVLTLAPGHTRASISLAQLLERQDAPTQAVQIYRTLLSLHPDRPEARALLAQLLMGMGREEEALLEYAQIQGLEPAHFAEGPRGRGLALASHLNYGMLLLRHHRPQEALPPLRAALALCPSQGPLPATIRRCMAQALQTPAPVGGSPLQGPLTRSVTLPALRRHSPSPGESLLQPPRS